jgi:flagellar biogenesis protein FliO
MVFCAACAPVAPAQTPAPLIEYRRADAEAANPLREQLAPPAPATTTTPSPTTAVVRAAATAPAPSDPAAAPPPEPVYRDAQFDATEFQVEEQESQAPKEVEPARPLESAPVAPVIDPVDFAAPAATEPALPSLRLAPPSTHTRTSGLEHENSPATRLVPQAFTKFTSLSTAGGGLAIVVGLFLVSMWLMRGSGVAKRGGGTLPPEAFAVLGRAPLTAQSFAQLLRLGNKLVLVAVAADGAQPLAEVTDPAEVDRLVGLCAKTAPHGPSAEFQQVLEQLSREPARGFLGREATSARRRA